MILWEEPRKRTSIGKVEWGAIKARFKRALEISAAYVAKLKEVLECWRKLT